MSMRYLTALFLAIAMPGIGWCEVVHFKNGDRLTGSFVRLVDKTAIFKTSVLGTVDLKLKEIDTFTTKDSVVVMLKGGQTERGHLTLTQEGKFRLQSAGIVSEIRKSDVEAIYPVKVYRPASPERRHKIWQDWKAKGNVGYNLQHSSGQSNSLTVGFDALRLEPSLPGFAPRRRSHYSLNMAFINVTSSSGVTTSANTLSSDFQQDFFFSRNPHNFIFLEAQLDHIEPQNIQLRQTYGGGYGRDVLQKPSISLSLRAGTTYVREHFMPALAQQNGGILLRNNAEALLGEKFSFDIFKHFDFTHELDVYPSLTTAGNYRFDTVSAISTPISPLFSIQAQFTDHFLSQPLPGTEKNDLIFSTGVGFKF